MLKFASFVVLVLCCALAAWVLGSLGPMYLHTISVDSEGWGSKFFFLLASPVIVGSAVLLAASVVLYRRKGSRLDVISSCVAGMTLAAMILAWILVEPLRQWIIFGK